MIFNRTTKKKDYSYMKKIDINIIRDAIYSQDIVLIPMVIFMM